MNVDQLSNEVTGQIRTFNGRIEIDGYFKNSGKLLNAASTIDNTGIFINIDDGIISNNWGSNIINSGDLQNHAEISNGGGLGAGLFTNSGSLTNYASGVFTNADDGTVNNLDGGTIQNEGTFQNEGLVTNDAHNGIVNSGALVVSQIGKIDGAGSFVQNAGSTVNEGLMIQSTFDILGGTISGSGTWLGDMFVGENGAVLPGSSPGLMTIEGDFVCDGCSLFFEFAGTEVGEFDFLDITGTASFTNANFTFEFINGFVPDFSNPFSFISASEILSFEGVAFAVLGLDAGKLLNILPNSLGTVAALTSDVAPVPLPAAFPLFASVLSFFSWIGWRRRRRKQKSDLTMGAKAIEA